MTCYRRDGGWADPGLFSAQRHGGLPTNTQRSGHRGPPPRRPVSGPKRTVCSDGRPADEDCTDQNWLSAQRHGCLPPNAQCCLPPLSLALLSRPPAAANMYLSPFYVPTGGRPPHENEGSFPAPGVTPGDPPHRKPTPGPTTQPIPQPGPAGRERSPPPRRSSAQRANNSSSPGTSLAPSTWPRTSRGERKSFRLLDFSPLNSLGLRPHPRSRLPNTACTPKMVPESPIHPDQRGRHPPNGLQTFVWPRP
jgi:hypothetical protein